MALSFIRYHCGARASAVVARKGSVSTRVWTRQAGGPAPRLALLCILMICTGCGRAATRTRKVAVAAAADLKFAMEEISLEFHRAHPDVELRTSYGSSGNFYSQIHNGAPFDAFLSADVEYPRRLLRERIGAAGSRFVYGGGGGGGWGAGAAARGPGGVGSGGIDARSGCGAPGRRRAARRHRQSATRAVRAGGGGGLAFAGAVRRGGAQTGPRRRYRADVRVRRKRRG